jgi:hypothetical protein
MKYIAYIKKRKINHSIIGVCNEFSHLIIIVKKFYYELSHTTIKSTITAIYFW